MIEIVFLTSNIIKLAHARYLSKRWDVNIIQHKLLHYGIGYEEPRLIERDKLLKESVEDAIHRWEKRRFTSKKRLYILEDTSVKIDAISTKDQEVPGVDVKYWMKEITYNKLNTTLIEKGNNRQTRVYSHLVLILNEELKEKIGKEYIIFSSYSDGTIVPAEIPFNSNKLYPWLDNKSFNKWFVPLGEKAPLGMLPIEKADLYDFRKGAFEEMFNFLSENKKINYTRNLEMDLTFVFSPIFIVTGPTCAGKTTLGKFLLENYNYYHIEASDFMLAEFLENHGHKSEIRIGEFAKEILKVKPHIVVTKIFEYLRNNKSISSIIITGFRTIKEIQYFMKYSPLRNSFSVIYVDANYDIRYIRWIKRKRNIKQTDEDYFKLENNLQRQIGVEEIKKLENIINIQNNGTFSEYYEEFIKRCLSGVSVEKEYDFSTMANLEPRSLEDAILLFLAIDYKENKMNYYTTTEIAHKINSTFKSLEKHKDNVSRYFNQKIHPFFEFIVVEDKIKYKLSPTGYSKAISILKNLVMNNNFK